MPVPVAPVTYQILVNGLEITDRPLDVELRQEFGKHELFFVRIEYQRLTRNITTLPIWPKNAPVQINWGRGAGNQSVWYGYVGHHEIKSNADSGSKALQVTYTCIGTSKMMNSEVTRTWGQSTPTYIAKQLAAEHKLRAVLSSTTWISDYEVQSSESDFRFLCRMAEKYGYRFFVSGGTLYFIDPATVIAGSSSQGVPIFQQDKRFAWQDSIRDLVKLDGDQLPGSEQAVRAIAGIDQNSGQPFIVAATGTTGQALTKLHTGYVARSVAEAKIMANAWQNQTQFFIQAKAELFGNTLLYPGKMVYLQGDAMPADMTGFWMVCAADHVLMQSGTSYTVLDKFVTRVRLIRNQTGSLPGIKKLNVINPEFVSCVASNGVWGATSMAVFYDGVRQ